MSTITRPSHEDGIAVYQALCAKHDVDPVEVRWFASAHLAQDWPAGHGIGSSDVSCHLSSLGNYQPEVLEAECIRLAERNALVRRVASNTGESFEDTLALMQQMFAPLEED